MPRIGTLHFYPRSPCGERRSNQSIISQANNFYPRSPCGERLVDALKLAGPVLFLSTLSLRRATACPKKIGRLLVISIHALLAESDSAVGLWILTAQYFYPRSPCGERHLRVLDGSKSSIISIHALLAESDHRVKVYNKEFRAISIHALLAESDNKISAIRITRENFYPRSPCGERLGTLRTVSVKKTFLSTLSLRRATSEHCER